MVGLLLLKQLENLSDEKVVIQFKRNPYYQAFCGFTEFSCHRPCDSTELVHFRKRIGTEGFETIFQMSVQLHGKAALEKTVNIDTTVQEKNIHRFHRRQAGDHDHQPSEQISQKTRYSTTSHLHKRTQVIAFTIRHFRHVKRRAKAKKALKRLRTIAGILIRELRCTLPQVSLFERYQKDFLFYERVLNQQPKDSNKTYSLHEPDVDCIGKGKNHKQYGTATRFPLQRPQQAISLLA